MKKSILLLYFTASFCAYAKAQCWQSMTAGDGYSLAIKTNGTLWAWGGNSIGQLGDGTDIDKNSPVQISTASNWQSVAASEEHTLAIKTDGTLWAWGANSFGQLGVVVYLFADDTHRIEDARKRGVCLAQQGEERSVQAEAATGEQSRESLEGLQC
jgi:alpha-tubulin suppressor-like RCC1 family protein